MPAYGFDDEGEREHDSCGVCGSGSCPGSGSGGDDACTYDRQRHHDASPCYDQGCRLRHPRGGPFPHPCATGGAA